MLYLWTPFSNKKHFACHYQKCNKLPKRPRQRRLWRSLIVFRVPELLDAAVFTLSFRMAIDNDNDFGDGLLPHNEEWMNAVNRHTKKDDTYRNISLRVKNVQSFCDHRQQNNTNPKKMKMSHSCYSIKRPYATQWVPIKGAKWDVIMEQFVK